MNNQIQRIQYDKNQNSKINDLSVVQNKSIHQSIDENNQCYGKLKIEEPFQHMTYKIKDGLYLGTSIQAFKDQQFILLNWIQHIILYQHQNYIFPQNLKSYYGQENDQIIQEGQQIIKYLHVNDKIFRTNQQNQSNKHIQLLQQNIQKQQNYQHSLSNSILDKIKTQKKTSDRDQTQNFQQIMNFIENASQQGSSCLILLCSNKTDMNGIGATFSLLTGYFMKKYKWSLYKSLQYMNNIIKGIRINQLIFEYLTELEVQLLSKQTLTYDWKIYKTIEQLTLRNTFLNSMKQLGLDQIRYNSKLEIHESNIEKLKKNKSKSKFQKPFKKLKTQSGNSQIKQLNQQVKSILKISINKKQKLNTRISINLSLNQIKEYIIQKQNKKDNIKDINNNQTISLNKRQQQKQISHHYQQTLNNSKIKQISICVKNIVSSYKKEKEKDTLKRKNKKKFKIQKLNFQDCSELNLKKLNKHKSYYNIITCDQKQQKSNHSLEKAMQKSNFIKIINYNNSNKEINEEKSSINLSQLNLKNLSIPSLELMSRKQSNVINSLNTDSLNSKKLSQCQKQFEISKQQRQNWLSIISKQNKSKLLEKLQKINKQKIEKTQISLHNEPYDKHLKQILIKNKSNIQQTKGNIHQQQTNSKLKHINSCQIKQKTQNDQNKQYQFRQKDPKVISNLLTKLKQQSLQISQNKKVKKEQNIPTDTHRNINLISTSLGNLKMNNRNKWR